MSGARIAAALRRLPADEPALPWQLLWRPTLASTELALERCLQQGLRPPLAVIARRQSHGHGQQGRPWLSPAGGVWLSAAVPWTPAGAGLPVAAPALAVAVGLALQLERHGLRPQIKWPNDLLLDGRKLAGILPRLRWRGEQLQGCRVGVGLNGCNRVPPGAINLSTALRARADRPSYRPAALLEPERLAALVLRGLEWAVAAAGQAELVRRQAERRLRRDPAHWHDGQEWEVIGLSLDGGLRLRRGAQLVEQRRDF